MSIKDWATMRKKWVAARDGAKPKVGMGAVKGVKLGESIDAVYKAGQKDYLTLYAALKTLLDDTTKYKAGIKAKNPNLAKWIDSNIEDAAKKLQTDVEADVKLLRAAIKFYGKFNERSEAYYPDKLVPLAVQADSENKLLKVLAPEAHKRLGDATDFYKSIGKALAKTAQGLTLEVPKSPVNKRLSALAGSLAHDVAIMQTVVDAADKPNFALALRPHVAIPDALWDHARDGYVALHKALNAKQTPRDM